MSLCEYLPQSKYPWPRRKSVNSHNTSWCRRVWLEAWGLSIKSQKGQVITPRISKCITNNISKSIVRCVLYSSHDCCSSLAMMTTQLSQLTPITLPLSRHHPPHPVAHQSLILATSIVPLSSRPHISPAHRSPSSPPLSCHPCQDWPCPSSPCYTSEPHLGHSCHVALIKTLHLPSPQTSISELALCHSNLLCGLTLCCTEIVFKSPVRSGFLAPKQRNRTKTGPRKVSRAGNRQLDQ